VYQQNIINSQIERLKKEQNCPHNHRCLTENIAWTENLTPFAGLDLIQCLYNSKECNQREHHGYTYMCNCPMMQLILEKRKITTTQNK